jgi:hypothetical protein
MHARDIASHALGDELQALGCGMGAVSNACLCPGLDKSPYVVLRMLINADQKCQVLRQPGHEYEAHCTGLFSASVSCRQIKSEIQRC